MIDNIFLCLSLIFKFECLFTYSKLKRPYFYDAASLLVCSTFIVGLFYILSYSVYALILKNIVLPVKPGISHPFWEKETE